MINRWPIMTQYCNLLMQIMLKALVSRLKHSEGPASDDVAGSEGLLALFESMGWQISLGVHRMMRGRVRGSHSLRKQNLQAIPPI